MSESQPTNDDIKREISIAFAMGRLCEACRQFDGTVNSVKDVTMLAVLLIQASGFRVEEVQEENPND